MNSILIATDFTTASHNAAVFGTELARFYKTNAILVNVAKNDTRISTPPREYEAVLLSDQQLLKEAELLDPQGTLVDIVCDKGQTTEAILTLAHERHIGLIVTGLKKNTPGKHVSTCLLLSKHTASPILMIPEESIFQKFTQLIFLQTNIGSGDLQHGQLPKLSSTLGVSISKVIVDEEEIENFSIGQETIKMMSATMVTGDVPAIHTMADIIRDAVRNYHADAIVLNDPSEEWLSATALAAVPVIVLPA